MVVFRFLAGVNGLTQVLSQNSFLTSDSANTSIATHEAMGADGANAMVEIDLDQACLLGLGSRCSEPSISLSVINVALLPTDVTARNRFLGDGDNGNEEGREPAACPYNGVRGYTLTFGASIIHFAHDFVAGPVTHDDQRDTSKMY